MGSLDQNGAVSSTLIVGSLSTAVQAQTLLKTLESAGTARFEILDRIIDRAAIVSPGSVTRSIVILDAQTLQSSLSTLLPALSPLLAPSASLEVRLDGVPFDESLSSSFVLAGLVDVKQDGNSLLATKPAQAKSVPLRLRPKGDNAAKKASLWKLTSAPPTGPSIDPDSLLTEEDLRRPEVIQRPDCDVKKTRKACKNCTCGLREVLLEKQDDIESISTTAAGTGSFTSSCGNCNLGDAFRCASCPYLGMPAFEVGKPVKLAGFVGDDI